MADPGYALRNLDELENTAPRFGLAVLGEVRPAREALDARSIGLTRYQWKPGRRVGFGHFHQTDEEIYVVVRGGGRIKLNDDVVEIRTNDAIRVAPTTIREWVSSRPSGPASSPSVWVPNARHGELHEATRR